MATSFSRIGSPGPSSLSSVYQDAPESCAQTDAISNKESTGRRYGGAQRTIRARIGSVSSSEHSSTHGRSPYRSQRLKHTPRSSQPERYTYRGSATDKAMNKIIRQLEMNLETYTEIQAQEALDLAHAAMKVLHAEEMYIVERLGEGRVQLRALENKVGEVKNRLRIAELQMGFLKQKIVANGFTLSDDAAQNFAERLQRNSMDHHSLTASDLARISAPPPAVDSPPQASTVTDFLLQEPVARLDVSGWARTTLPGAPVADAPNNDDCDTLDRDIGAGALYMTLVESKVDALEGGNGRC